MPTSPLRAQEPGVFRADANLTPSAAILSRTVLAAPGLKLVRFTMGEGAELTEHQTSQSALVQIVEGHCEFALGEQRHELAAGDVVWLPPGTPHAVKARGPLTFWLVLQAGTGSIGTPSNQPISFAPRRST